MVPGVRCRYAAIPVLSPTLRIHRARWTALLEDRGTLEDLMFGGGYPPIRFVTSPLSAQVFQVVIEALALLTVRTVVSWAQQHGAEFLQGRP
jgi:hypothetical protein